VAELAKFHKPHQDWRFDLHTASDADYCMRELDQFFAE
jgi:hypothetical protein